MSSPTIAHRGSQAELHRVPILDDNYTWIVTNSSTAGVAVIDPGDGAAVVDYCSSHSLTPTEIINTHHHADHIAGNEAVREAFAGIPLVGPGAEVSRIAGMDKTVGHGDKLEIAGFMAEVIATPGHTSGHVVFYLADCFGDGVGLLLAGDTLFSLGCGRVLEGSMGEMWRSLQAVRALPDATIVCAGHEYSQANGQYAMSLGWDNEDLKRLVAAIAAKRGRGEATLPFRLGDEKLGNPFLNADNASLAKALGMADADSEAVFTALRRGKDEFRG